MLPVLREGWLYREWRDLFSSERKIADSDGVVAEIESQHHEFNGHEVAIFRAAWLKTE